MARFPNIRLRRLRRTEILRDMFCETSLDTNDLVYPVFVVPGHGVREEIDSMPGNMHISVDLVPAEVEEIHSLGIPAVILFGIPETKDDLGSSAFAADGTVQRAVREIKRTIPELVVITDVCLCHYTSHGHCGVLENDYVNNDKSLDAIARTALSHVEAGADIVAPSDMMDGRVGAIRSILDNNTFYNAVIMSYAAKYASAFYGPFREAADSTPSCGDRKSYQMDPANMREAIREVGLDIDEGADIVMIKPALAYLDVIRRVRDTYNYPLAAYNVSGEYAMVKAAARNGWVDEKQTAMEILTGIKRAGADLIITYFAKDVARWLKDDVDVS